MPWDLRFKLSKAKSFVMFSDVFRSFSKPVCRFWKKTLETKDFFSVIIVLAYWRSHFLSTIVSF